MSKMFKKLQVFTKTIDFHQATKIVEIPLREPNENEIRIKNIYVGINATDMHLTDGRYCLIDGKFSQPNGKLPFDIGLESLGLIDAIGSKLKSKFQLKQPVLIINRSDCFSEYSYTKETELILLPEFKPEYLVSMINGMTACIAMDIIGKVKAKDKVLITAAAGGTGQIVVQWAKYHGAYVIAMTSSEKKAKYLRELGADFIINYHKDNLDEILKKNFPNGLDIIWETIGGEIFNTLFNHLSNKGRMIIIGIISKYKQGIIGEPFENIQSRLLFGSKTISGFGIFDYLDLIPEYMPKLISKIYSDEFKVMVDQGEESVNGKFYGLDQIWRAEEYLYSGQSKGKVIVQIQEP